jgi:hypothetical protein
MCFIPIVKPFMIHTEFDYSLYRLPEMEFGLKVGVTEGGTGRMMT